MGLFRKKSISQSYEKAKGFRKKSKYWGGGMRMKLSMIPCMILGEENHLRKKAGGNVEND